MSTTTELERLIIRLVGDSSNYERMLEQAKVKTQSAAQKITQIGNRLTTAITGPLALVGGLSVRAFSQFDQAMTESTSIMSVTEEQVQRMRETALTLSTQGARGPAELARAYFYLASAGKDAEQSMSLLPSLTRFATAGAFDLALATDLLTDAQSALGLSSRDVARDTENLARVADTLVRANTLANATVQQFSEALTNNAGASLRAFNKDVEEGVAILAAYADQGIKGQVAGSMLSRVMLLLSQSSRMAADEHERLGFSVFDSEGRMRNFADIIRNLEQITAGMSDELKAATLEQLGFQARVQQAILPLLGTSDAISRYERELRDAAGTTGEVANRQMRSFSNQLKIIWNQITVASIAIGEQLAPAVLVLAQGVSYLTRQFISLSPVIKGGIVFLGSLLALLGPVASAVGYLMTNFVAIRGAMSGVLALIPGWGWLAAAIIGVVSAIFGVEDSLNAVRGVAGSTWEYLTSAAQAFWDWFEPIWDQLYRTVSTTLMGIRTLFITLFNTVSSVFSHIGSYLAEVWNTLTGGMVLDTETIQSTLISMLRAAEYGILNFDRVASLVWTGMLHQVATFSNDVGYFFGQYLPVVFSNWGTLTRDVFLNTFRYATHVITSFLSGTTSEFEAVWSELLSPPDRELSQMERELGRSFQEQGDALTEGFNQFSRELDLSANQRQVDEAVNTAEQAGREVGRNFNDGVTSQLSDTFDAVASGSAAALQKIQQSREQAREQASQASNPLQNMLNTLGNSLQGVGQTGVNAQNQIRDTGVGAFGRIGSQGSALFSQWEFSWDTLMGYMAEVWSAAIDGFRTPLYNLYDNLYNLNSDLWMNADALQNQFWEYQTDQWNMWWDVAETFWPGIGETATGVWDEILEYAQGVWESIQAGFTQVIEFLAAPLGGVDAVQSGVNFLADPVGAFTDYWNNDGETTPIDVAVPNEPVTQEQALALLNAMVQSLNTIANQPVLQVEEVSL